MSAKAATSTPADKDVASLQVSLPQMLDLALGTPEVKRFLQWYEIRDVSRDVVSRSCLDWSCELEHPAQFPSHCAPSDKFTNDEGRVPRRRREPNQSKTANRYRVHSTGFAQLYYP